MSRIGTLALAFVCLCALALPATAGAAMSSKATVTTSNGVTRLVVTISSTRAFTARTRPRGVTVKYGRRTYTLRRGGAAVVRSVWSKSGTGSAGAALAGLATKRVRVGVRSLAGIRTFLPKVAAVTPPAPPTPPTPPPTPPPTADARTRFLTMFNNSGWDRPYVVNAISYEDLYNFCADGRYFNRFTSGQTGTDYPSSGTWELAQVATGTVAGYAVVEGRVILHQTSPEVKDSEIFVDLSEQVPNTAYISQKEYTRVNPGAC